MSSTRSDRIKARLEEDVVREFLLHHNWGRDRKTRFLRAGVPPEPDTICIVEGTGEQVGIEVGTAYYDAEHAKAAWGPPRGKQAKPHFRTRPDSEENLLALAQALRIIRAKGKKARGHYQVRGRLVLIVFTYPWRLYLCDVEDSLASLCVSTLHPFDEIYILSQYELYQLFPERGWIIK